MKGLDFIGSFAKAHYDKIVAFAILLGLLLSLLYLAVQIGSIQRLQKEHEERINLKPRHPVAETVDVSQYEKALASIRDPAGLSSSSWTNRQAFVPEKRVWCTDCRWPILFDAMTCPFCKSKQPPLETEDWERDDDRDGIPNLWEKKYGLDPYDRNDASKDLDGDGFSNIEEFGPDPAKGPVTSLSDAKDYPSVIAKLRLVRFEAHPFKLRFKSVIKLPGDQLKFALNLQTGRYPKTYFKKLGETVEGFTIFEYKPKTIMVKQPGWRKPRPKDVSELTLKRGEKLIRLIKDTDVQHNEYTVHFLFALDNTPRKAKVGETFTLKDLEYKLMKIDNSLQSVVIERLKDGKSFTIRRLPSRVKEAAIPGADAATPVKEPSNPVTDPFPF